MKMNIKKLFNMLVFIISLSVSSLSHAASLIAIIVADTSESAIGASVHADYLHMQEEVREMANHAGLDLQEIKLKGSTVRQATLLKQIQALKVQPDDVLLFYFAGHGSRKSFGGEIWPDLYFSLDDNGYQMPNLSSDAIIQKLQDKKPRLLITLTDVCNTVLSFEYMLEMNIAQFRPLSLPDPKVMQNYSHLLNDYSGDILITASGINEYSFCGIDGGFYTLSFLESMATEVSSTDAASWQHLLETAADYLGDEQHPIYQLNIKPI